MNDDFQHNKFEHSITNEQYDALYEYYNDKVKNKEKCGANHYRDRLKRDKKNNNINDHDNKIRLLNEKSIK